MCVLPLTDIHRWSYQTLHSLRYFTSGRDASLTQTTTKCLNIRAEPLVRHETLRSQPVHQSLVVFVFRYLCHAVTYSIIRQFEVLGMGIPGGKHHWYIIGGS